MLGLQGFTDKWKPVKRWGSYMQLHGPFHTAQSGALHTQLRDTTKSSKNPPSHKCIFLEMSLQNTFERNHPSPITNKVQMPQLPPLTTGCSAVTQQGSLWLIIPIPDRWCRKKLRSSPVSTALLGKRDKGYAGWREVAQQREKTTTSTGRESAGRKVKMRMLILISCALR